MKLSIGIVGLPNVGKSTLFKILTKQDITIANYPFATIDPNVGVVSVPDERVDKLAEISKSKKKIPAIVEFYDIAGLVKGANEGEGLGNQFLSHIRECAAVLQVVRIFPSNEIIHVEGDTNPVRDINIIKRELTLKDLETVNKRLGSLDKEMRAGAKEAAANIEILGKIKEKLEQEKFVTEFNSEKIVNELQLLSAKPQIMLLNGEMENVKSDLIEKLKEEKLDYIVMNLANAEIIEGLIKKAYAVLGLQSFFTTGEDETRAWTIKSGAKAPEAAGTIHTDFENKFIRAEAVSYAKFIEAAHSTGSGQVWTKTKQKGWLRVEGKDYVMQDGDIVEIRHG